MHVATHDRTTCAHKPGNTMTVHGELTCAIESLRLQIDTMQEQGISSVELAVGIRNVMEANATLLQPKAETIAYRIAWFVLVYAPSYDPVLMSTLLFCLQCIEDGSGSFEEFFEQVTNANPVRNPPLFPCSVVTCSLREIKRLFAHATRVIPTDYGVQERIVMHLMNEPGAMISSLESVGSEGSLSKRSCDRVCRNKSQHKTRQAADDTCNANTGDWLGGEAVFGWPRSKARFVARRLVTLSYDAADWSTRLNATRRLLSLQRSGAFG